MWVKERKHKNVDWKTIHKNLKYAWEKLYSVSGAWEQKRHMRVRDTWEQEKMTLKRDIERDTWKWETHQSQRHMRVRSTWVTDMWESWTQKHNSLLSDSSSKRKETLLHNSLAKKTFVLQNYLPKNNIAQQLHNPWSTQHLLNSSLRNSPQLCSKNLLWTTL